MFYYNAFAPKSMCESLRHSAMDLCAYIEIGKIPLVRHYMKLQWRIHVISLTRNRLCLFGFRRDSGKQQEKEAMKEGLHLHSFKAQTSFWGNSDLVKPLPHIHRQHVAFLDIVAIPRSLLTRGSGHQGFPSRLGYGFPHGLMNHCGLEPAMRVKLAPTSFLGTAREENPIYLGQAYLKADFSNQVCEW